MALTVVALLAVSFTFSLVACTWLLRLSRKFNLLDDTNGQEHKRLGQRIPNTGGIAIFLAVAVPMTVAMQLVLILPNDWWERLAPAVLPHLAGLRRMVGVGGGVLVALSLMHVMGLMDDRRALGPFVKLFYQAVVAFMLVALCDIRVLHLMDEWGWWGVGLSGLISMGWILVIVNAMNFLDNMDGLAAGVGATIATVYLGATLIGGQWFIAGMAALLLGALLGFLLFNFPPAKLYMGDGGSLVLGLLLAIISVRTTYFDTTPTGGADVSPGIGPSHSYAVLMPLMVLAIPLYDFVSVTFIRLLEGRSPFSGDTNHFSHRLVRKGLSRQRAVVLIWMCTLATGLGGVMIGTLEDWQALLIAAQTLVILAMLATLERGTPKIRDLV